MEAPVVLALDCATSTVVACVWRDGRTLAAGARGGARAAQSALELCDGLLAEAGVGVAALGGVAAGLGPGSYTGLRVGLATARALGLALDVPVAGASTLDVLLAGDGVDCAVIDARRGELFVAARGLEPCVVQPAMLPGLVAAGALCAGDGALRHRAALEAAGLRVPADADARHVPDPAVLARLVVAHGFAGGSEPLYLRAPDAAERAA